MRKTLIGLFLILMVCGLVSSAYAEKLGMTEDVPKISEQERIKPVKFEKIKIERLGIAVGREVKILDSQGKPVSITDEKGKPVSLIVGSKGNLVVQKLTAIEKPGLIKQEIIKTEKPTITRPAKPQKPEFTKPQPITNLR